MMDMDLCQLVTNYEHCKKLKKKTTAAIYATLSWKDIKSILNAIGESSFKGKSRAKAAELILKFIKTHCQCQPYDLDFDLDLN